MQKFWWSSETDADISDSCSHLMQEIDARLNQLLGGIDFGGKVEQWAFIPIILPENVASSFPEVARKSSRGKVLEFRVKVSHSEFLSANQSQRANLIFQALSRSVERMASLGVSEQVQKELRTILARVQNEIAQSGIVQRDSNEDVHSGSSPERLAAASVATDKTNESAQPATSDVYENQAIKLYRNEAKSNTLRYWEARQEEKHVIIHQGVVGTPGVTRHVPLSPQVASTFIQAEADRLRAEGYVEFKHEELFPLRLEFRIDEPPTTLDLDRRYEVEKRINECLEGHGLGYCDGGDIGSGTMSVFCFAVDSGKAIPLIRAELESLSLLRDAKISLSSDADEEVVWSEPDGTEGKLAH